jgi:hypothetical protein
MLLRKLGGNLQYRNMKKRKENKKEKKEKKRKNCNMQVLHEITEVAGYSLGQPIAQRVPK